MHIDDIIVNDSTTRQHAFLLRGRRDTTNESIRPLTSTTNSNALASHG